MTRAPRLVWLAPLVAALVIAFLRASDPFGDHGLANAASLGVALLGGIVALVSFACARRYSLRTRIAGVALVLGGVALSAALVRVRGVSGELVPELAWRHRGQPEGPELAREPVSAPTGAAAARLALAPPADDDFPAFLGPRRDNAVPGIALARDWTAQPPRLLWRAPIGAGWSAFAVAGGYAFTLEQDAHGQRVSARAAASGALGWSVALDEPFLHVLGGDGPRATPTVELGPAPGAGRVYALSAYGKLACLAAESGELLWSHDLEAEFGLSRAREAELAQYGRSTSPLLVGELVIVPAGGEGEQRAGLVAFDARTGALRWRSPARFFSHSSPAFATLAGVPQILCVNEASVSGHALLDGRLLWEHPWVGETSAGPNVSQAVPVPPARVLVSKGYGSGALLLELAARSDPEAGDASGALDVREVWRDGRLLRTKFTNVVVHDGFVYGLDDGMLECVELESGAKRWKEGRYGHGQILLAGALLLVLSEEGEVFLLEPDPARPNAVLGSFQGLEGKCWAHLALAQGVLFLRNAEECAAWRLPTAD